MTDHTPAGKKLTVAVVFGGQSTEHSVSCISAGSILSHLDPERFHAVPVGITHQGKWVMGDSNPESLRIADRQLPTVADGTAITVTASPAEVLSHVDVVFPVLHGAYGEDGTIQGLLEMAGVPYVGAGVLASAVGMDKIFTKKVLGASGLPNGDFVEVDRAATTLTQAERDRLGLPVFVKPSRAGSSTGITRVTDWADLDAAIATAREIDPKVLIEAAIIGREVECGVLEFPDGRIEASLPAEVRIQADGPDWYDFEAKYLDAVTELDIPAKLDDDIIENLRATAVKAFKAVDGQGLARVDFFVREDGSLIINEINTMPGFTSTSAYPKMWAVTGVDYPTLLTTLVETAIVRGIGLR
jgi:D-alanine-D-alanine ligase